MNNTIDWTEMCKTIKVVAEQENWKIDSFQVKKNTHHLLATQTTPMARTVKTTAKPNQNRFMKDA